MPDPPVTLAHPAICGACHRPNPVELAEDLPSGTYRVRCRACGAAIEIGVLSAALEGTDR